MKKGVFLLLFLILATGVPRAGFGQTGIRAEADDPGLTIVNLDPELRRMNGVVSVEYLDPGPFREKYLVEVTQPLDYSDPEAGTFVQRFVVGYAGKDAPTVIVTEGYRADYALKPEYREEISARFGTNLVVVEHRYFAGSTPSPRNWDYLTVAASMNDLHRIRTMLAPLYPEKWIATGISKGGTTTLMYKTYFPDDTDICVPYVGPVCFGVEDGRHEPFIASRCGTPEQREKVRTFQIRALREREAIRPLFEAYCREKGLKFRIPTDEAYDYCVLEYSFAFWQWGVSPEDLPAEDASPKAVLDHLVKVVGPDYFAVNDEPSFFVQAARELGYYGYDVRPFREWLTIGSARGYLRRIMLPEDAKGIRFSRRVGRDVYRYLRRNDPKMICIYGEYDPWSAVAPDASLFEGKKNLQLVVKPGGSHRTRIGNLPEGMQEKVWDRLSRWLNE